MPLYITVRPPGVGPAQGPDEGAPQNIQFDPSQPFEVIGGPTQPDQQLPAEFDPSQPFEPMKPSEPPVPAGSAGKQPGFADYALAPFSGFNKALGLPVSIAQQLLSAPIGGGTARMIQDIFQPEGDKGASVYDIIEKLGLGKRPQVQIGSPEFIEKNTPFAPPPPDTIGGRALHRIGEEFGAAALPSMGLLKWAGGVLPGAVKTAPSLAKDLQKSIALNPGKATAGEVAATAGSGTAASASREAFPDNPTFEQIAQIAGGFTPGLYAKVAPTALAIKGVNYFRKTFSPSAQAAAGRKAAADLIGKEMTPEASAGLNEADRLSQAIPGFKPSVAEAAGTPALVAQQKNLDARASAQELDRIVARRRANEAAVNQFAENVAPQGENNPEFVVNAAKNRVDRLTGNIEAQQRDVNVQRSNIASNAFPVADRSASGATIRGRLDAIRGERRAEMDVLANELGINNSDITAEFTDWSRRTGQRFAPRLFTDQGNAPRVLGDITEAGRPTPATPPAASNVIGPDGRPIVRPGTPEQPAVVTFGDLKRLRERVTDDLIDATGTANPSRKQVRELTQLKNDVDRFMDEIVQNSTDPNLAARYAEFRRQYFDRYVRPFEQGAAHKVRGLDGNAFYKMNDEKVADAFFQKGNTTAADQFNEIFAGDQAAHDALRGTVVDRMRDAVVRDGVIDQQRLVTWLRDHRSVLARFPDIMDEIRTPAMADAAYVRRQTQLGERQRRIEDTMLSRALAGYERGTNPDAIIDAALKDRRKMGQLVSGIRQTDGALPALRRNVWDKATDGDAASILKFIHDNRPALSRLFTPEHLTNLETVAGARAMLQRVPDPVGTAYVPRPLGALEEKLGISLPRLISRWHVLITGRAQKEWVMAETAINALRGRAQVSMDDALRTALYDPEMARELASRLELSSTPDIKGVKKLQSRLIALGLPLTDRKSEE